MDGQQKKILVGWSEWCSLPALGVARIKAKLDTGAKTSALHARDIKPFYRRSILWVEFYIEPLIKMHTAVHCKTKVIDQRFIMSSSGHKERRYIISTSLLFSEEAWPIELSLSNRDPMQFRLLLGRQAMGDHLIIDPHRANCQSKKKKNVFILPCC